MKTRGRFREGSSPISLFQLQMIVSAFHFSPLFSLLEYNYPVTTQGGDLNENNSSISEELPRGGTH